MDIPDFQLKYDDTVLMIHLYVRADQAVPKLQKNVLRAARGPQLDAVVAWTEIPPGRKLGTEADNFGDQRALVEEFLRNSTKDVVVFHLCINTGADPRKLGDNIKRAAQGPRLDAMVSVIEHYAGSNGRKVWGLIQQLAQRAHADPAARPYTP